MKRALRWLLDFDRSYFLALSAFIAALTASIYLAVGPTYVRTTEDGVKTSHTLIEVNGVQVVVLLIIPLLITVGPLLVLPRKTAPVRRSQKINSAVATFVLLVLIGLGAWSFGLLYVPALILSSASSASLFFGRDRKRGAAKAMEDRRQTEPRQQAPQAAVGGNQPRMSGKRPRRKRAKR